MKKLIIGAVIIGVFVVPPFFIGQNIESHVDNAVETINDINGYSASKESFEKGWFSSSSTIKVTLDDVLMPEQDTESEYYPELYLNTDIRHGLFFLNPLGMGLTQFQVTPQVNDEFKKLAKDNIKINFNNKNEIIEIIGKVGFGGGVDTQGIVPAMQLEVLNENTQTPVNLTLDEYVINLKLNQDDNRISYESESTPLNVTVNSVSQQTNTPVNVNILLGAIKSQGYVIRNNELKNIQHGEQKALIDSIRFIQDDNELFKSGEFLLDFSYLPDDELRFAVALNNITVKGFKTGISKLANDFSIVDINIELEKAFDNWYDTIVKHQEEPEMVQAANAQILSVLQEYPPSLKVNDIIVDLESGERFYADGFLSVDTEAMAQGLPLPLMFDAAVNAKISNDFLSEIFVLSKRIELQSQIDAGALSEEQVTQMLDAVKESSEQMMQIPLQTGYLVKDDQGYSAKIELKEGSFMVNGHEQPLPLPNLQ